MSTLIAAPYPTPAVTTVLPPAEFLDGRASEAEIQIKRTMTGEVWTYAKSSDKETINLQFKLTRMKDLELAAFIQIFQSAKWKLTLHDGSTWVAELVGDPIRRVASERLDKNNLKTGNELIIVTLTFSATRLI